MPSHVASGAGTGGFPLCVRVCGGVKRKKDTLRPSGKLSYSLGIKLKIEQTGAQALLNHSVYFCAVLNLNFTISFKEIHQGPFLCQGTSLGVTRPWFTPPWAPSLMAEATGNLDGGSCSEYSRGGWKYVPNDLLT